MTTLARYHELHRELEQARRNNDTNKSAELERQLREAPPVIRYLCLGDDPPRPLGATPPPPMDELEHLLAQVRAEPSARRVSAPRWTAEEVGPANVATSSVQDPLATRATAQLAGRSVSRPAVESLRIVRDSEGQHGSHSSSEPSAARSSTKKHVVLFLAANPVGVDRLALDEEARAIQVELERCGHRDRFEFTSRWAAQPIDLLRELRKLKPTVVHFSGHGSWTASLQRAGHQAPRRDVASAPSLHQGEQRNGLYFQGADGRARSVSAATLKDTFGAAGVSVGLVVLNACYSEAEADALLAHVDCVVGVNGPIRDEAARSFAIGFYRALGERESIVAAYQQGGAAISLEGLQDAGRPQLKVRDGIDARQLVLAGDLHANPTAAGATRRPTSEQASALESRVQIEMTIDAELEPFDDRILDRVMSELGRLSGDPLVRMISVCRESVRLKVAVLPAAARALMERKTTGELTQICGLRVSAVVEVCAAEATVQAFAREHLSLGQRHDYGALRRVVGGRSQVEYPPEVPNLEWSLIKVIPSLLVLAQRLLRNEADADDLVQDTIERALRHGMPANEQDLRSWLWKIMCNLHLDRLKRSPGIARDAALDVAFEPAVPERRESPIDDITDRELNAAIETLEPELRKVVELCFLEQMRYREAAEVLQISPSAVATRLTRARQRLRQVLASNRRKHNETL